MNSGRLQRLWLATAAVCAAGGCLGERSTGPQLAGTVTLAASQFGLFTGSQAGLELRFPAADTGGAQYLLVGQLATSDPDLSAAFDLVGGQASAVLAAARVAPRTPGAARRFHDNLRRLDAAAALASRGSRPFAAPPARTGPPAPGSFRAFRVCADLNCRSTALVNATVQYVGTHAAIYVDTLSPAGGYAAADLQRLGAQFDSVLYPIATAAFGAPTDVDNNGLVLVVLTPQVNALTPSDQCGSLITGYFLGADLAPATRAVYNDGEIFYGLVADANGAAGCAVLTATALSLVAPTFIHEFQHMISFGQHVLARGGAAEVLWLNEGLSHLAEELAGRHYDSLGADSVASTFLLNDLFDAYLYMQTPSGNPMVTTAGPGTLEERGGEWLFVRYLVDRFGAGVTQQLEQTPLVGADNVVAVTGTPFATLLGRWALALYVSDLPGLTPDSALTYKAWAFRTTFPALNQQYPQFFTRTFPLIPATAASGAFSLLDVVSSGSGTYLIVTQPPSGQAFTITFTVQSTGSNTSPDPQLAIVRLR